MTFSRSRQPAQPLRSNSGDAPVIRSNVFDFPRAFFTAVVMTGLLWLIGVNQVTLIEISCAFAIALFASIAFVRWRNGADPSSVPLLAFVLAMYWAAFALPMFSGKETVIGVGGEHLVSQATVTTAMMAATLGTAMLWLGYQLGGARRIEVRERIVYRSTPGAHYYLYCILAAGLIAQLLLERLVGLFGAALREPVLIATQYTPLAAFALLAIDYYRGRINYIDRVALPSYFIARTVVGVASGWLGSAVELGIVALVVYILRWRRMPVTVISATVLVILFLQPGKQQFRYQYWYNESEAGIVDRTTNWISQSAHMWKAALYGESAQDWRDLTALSLQRVDLVHQTANVINYTPSVVPYQNGRLYSYVFVALIPRFVWANKPTMNDANRWYQVAYGLTDENSLDTVSIACGYMTEGYINFGWLGIGGIMLAIGIFLRIFGRVMLSSSAGPYLNALGVAMLPHLIANESQLGQYVGGLVQMAVLTTFILMPVLVWQRKRRVHPTIQSLQARAALARAQRA